MDPVTTPPLPTVNNLDRATSKNADEKTALRSFDAFFVGEMLKRSMPEKTTGLFDGGDAGRMYQEHLFQELGRMVAEKGDFGIASSLEGTLSPKTASPAGTEAEAVKPMKPLPQLKREREER
ncbi:MAG: rod-binding protein [Myxococcota bacterium]